MDKLNSDSLEWALKHISRFGDSDFFPETFEFAAIRHRWLDILPLLLKIDFSNYSPRPSRRILVPKPNGNFRVVTQLDPIDALLYAAAVYEIAGPIEAWRIPKERNVACSYRISPTADGGLFESTNAWQSFRQQSRNLAEQDKFNCVLLTDIADFYNQASQHRIENALEQAGIASERAKSIESFLSIISAKQSRGVPVGPTASIVLTEACLGDVDSYLIRKGLSHTRYVDDFRIFCRSRDEAIVVLHDLTKYLYTSHRLVLNDSKTSIVEADEFLATHLMDPGEEEERRKLSIMRERVQAMFDLVGEYEFDDENTAVEDFLDDEDLKAAVRSNLKMLFDECLQNERLALGIARHILRRATSLRSNVLCDSVFSNLQKLAPVFPHVAQYIKSIKRAARPRGSELVDFLENSPLGQLDYCRIWGLEALCSVSGLATPTDLWMLAETAPQFQTRLMALVAKTTKNIDWVRERKEDWAALGPWDRRGLIYASSILPTDERRPWLGVVENTEDILEKAVAMMVR